MSRHAIASRLCFAFILVCGLAACGGGDAEDSAAASSNAASTLLGMGGDNGATSKAVRPADAGAWTGNGRYVTPEQAHILDASLADALIHIDVRSGGNDAVEEAIGMVWALQASANVPLSKVQVMVRGRDERLAAATVNRLLQSGVREVWLVTADPVVVRADDGNC